MQTRFFSLNLFFLAIALFGGGTGWKKVSRER